MGVGDLLRSIREGDAGTEDGVDAEVGCGRVTDMSGVECWVSAWRRSGGSCGGGDVWVGMRDEGITPNSEGVFCMTKTDGL